MTLEEVKKMKEITDKYESLKNEIKDKYEEANKELNWLYNREDSSIEEIQYLEGRKDCLLDLINQHI